MKCLFITSNRLGDAILTTGVLDWVIREMPDISVTVACGPVAAPVFKDCPSVERVIEMRKGRFSAHWRRLWLETIGQRWDRVVDLRGSAFSYLVRAGKRQIFTTPSAKAHRVDQLATALKIKVAIEPRLWIAEQNEATAAELIGDEARPILMLCPTSNWPPKAWAAERFREIATRLTRAEGPLSNARIAVACGPGEEDQAAVIYNNLEPTSRIDLMNKLPLMTLAAVMKRANLVIANDSGSMHLAAATGAPTLGLFGPSYEQIYAPRGPIAGWVRSEEPATDLLARAEEVARAPAALMQGLSVDRVEEAALQLLDKASISAQT